MTRMEEAIPAKRASADAIATTACLPRLPPVTRTLSGAAATRGRKGGADAGGDGTRGCCWHCRKSMLCSASAPLLFLFLFIWAFTRAAPAARVGYSRAPGAVSVPDTRARGCCPGPRIPVPRVNRNLPLLVGPTRSGVGPGGAARFVPPRQRAAKAHSTNQPTNRQTGPEQETTTRARGVGWSDDMWGRRGTLDARRLVSCGGRKEGRPTQQQPAVLLQQGHAAEL